MRSIPAVAIKWLTLVLIAGISRAEDWPQFLGPRRDGSSNDPIAAAWPKEGPAKSWEKSIGAGFAGPVVAGGKVLLFHRPGDEEKLDCFDVATGELKWSIGYRATYTDDFGFDPGPRAVPCVAGGRVFTYGPDGIVSATDFETGKRIWRLDAVKELGSPKGFFGRAPSPLVYGDLVLLNVGGGSGGIVALNTASGRLMWRAGEEEASYSSPTIAAFGGQTNALFLTRNELVGLEPLSGKIGFKYPFALPMRASVTGATPLVDGDLIFISASYGAGAAALKMQNGTPKKLWAADDVLSNHYATSVHRDGFLYGFDGRQENRPFLTCVEWKTGKSRWRQQMPAGSLVLAKDKLLVLLETGELILASADPSGYHEIARAQILGNGVRASPALSDGFLYARSKDKLARYQLR